MQLRLGSQWVDHEGNTFVIDQVHDNGAECWVSYHRVHDRTMYTCLVEAFTHRFSQMENIE